MADATSDINVYTERAYLLTMPVALFGGALSYTDTTTPGYPVLYVESPAGQLSWHIHPDDLWLFPNVPVVDNYPWDKHTTRVKYKRFRSLVKELPKLTYARPEYGNP